MAQMSTCSHMWVVLDISGGRVDLMTTMGGDRRINISNYTQMTRGYRYPNDYTQTTRGSQDPKNGEKHERNKRRVKRVNMKETSI